jgi:hypothetical protein
MSSGPLPLVWVSQGAILRRRGRDAAGGAGRSGDSGVCGFTLGSFDLCLLPFDPDADQLACLPGPRDQDPLRTTAAQRCQQPKPEPSPVHTRSRTHVCYICVRRRCVCVTGQSDTLTTVCQAGPSQLLLAQRGTGSGHGVQHLQVQRQLRHVLRHWSSHVLPRSPRGVGLHSRNIDCATWGCTHADRLTAAGCGPAVGYREFGCERPKSECFNVPRMVQRENQNFGFYSLPQ